MQGPWPSPIRRSCLEAEAPHGCQLYFWSPYYKAHSGLTTLQITEHSDPRAEADGFQSLSTQHQIKPCFLSHSRPCVIAISGRGCHHAQCCSHGAAPATLPPAPPHKHTHTVAGRGRKHATQSMSRGGYFFAQVKRMGSGGRDVPRHGGVRGQMTEGQKHRKRWGRKTRKAADERHPSEKGKGGLCQEKCANLMQLKEIFKETLEDFCL